MDTHTNIDLASQVTALKAEVDRCRRLSWQASKAREEVRFVLDQARGKIAESEARWAQSQRRYQQLEERMKALLVDPEQDAKPIRAT